MPVHDEPPALVIASLQALSGLRRAAFEVVVVDNNTPDEATWRPVQAACETLGPSFRFIHVDGLKGAKAGALNVAFAAVDARTTHVAVVDADYQAHPDFLADGLQAMQGVDVDYVQFPQAYRGVGDFALGVEHELGDYFACFEGGAGRPGSMLPTGTLSLFSARALRAVGGWPTQTITEDAEIGVRLQRAGYKGLWMSRERGRGLLPVDFNGLKVQRARWIAGNLQVLRGLCLSRWPGLTLGDFIRLTVQLTAWISLWLPLAGGLAVAALLPGFASANAIADIAATAILSSAVLTAARMLISFTSPRASWSAKLGAVVTKIALSWTSATAWLPALAPSPLTFRRTQKRFGLTNRNDLWLLAALSLGFLCLAGLYAARGQPLPAMACVLLAEAWTCARVVDRGLRAAAESSAEHCAKVA